MGLLWIAVSIVGLMGSLAASIAPWGDGLWVFGLGWTPAVLLYALDFHGAGLRDAARSTAQGNRP